MKRIPAHLCYPYTVQSDAGRALAAREKRIAIDENDVYRLIMLAVAAPGVSPAPSRRKTITLKSVGPVRLSGNGPAAR